LIISSFFETKERGDIIDYYMALKCEMLKYLWKAGFSLEDPAVSGTVGAK